MSVKMIALATINPENANVAKDYSASAKSVMSDFGGKPAYRWSTLEKLVGSAAPQITLVVEFNSVADLKACLESEAYQSLIPQRDLGFSQMNIFIAE